MRSSSERHARALDFLEGLSAADDDPRRILVGPDVPPEEIADRLEIHPLFRGWPQDAFNNLAEEAGLALRWRLRDGEQAVSALLAALAQHILNRGQVLWQRPDGITFWSLPDRDYPDLSIAQAAITSGGTPVLAGIYHGPSLRVFHGHTGRGIGSDLVVEHVLEHGRLLNWDLDSCAYSPAGEAAHLAALRKLEDLAGPELSAPGP